MRTRAVGVALKLTNCCTTLLLVTFLEGCIAIRIRSLSIPDKNTRLQKKKLSILKRTDVQPECRPKCLPMISSALRWFTFNKTTLWQQLRLHFPNLRFLVPLEQHSLKLPIQFLSLTTHTLVRMLGPRPKTIPK